jgi:hypothetical protein
MPTYTYEQLIEKVVRAKVALEGTLQEHPLHCPVAQGDGPCTCGADAHNARIQRALKELKL